MRVGQVIEIRRGRTGFWKEVTLDLVSENWASLAVSADEGLGSEMGFAVNLDTGRMSLLLLRKEPFRWPAPAVYKSIQTGEEWTIRCDHEPTTAALLTKDGWACVKCARIIGTGESPYGDEEKE